MNQGAGGAVVICVERAIVSFVVAAACVAAATVVFVFAGGHRILWEF